PGVADRLGPLQRARLLAGPHADLPVVEIDVRLVPVPVRVVGALLGPDRERPVALLLVGDHVDVRVALLAVLVPLALDDACHRVLHFFEGFGRTYRPAGGLAAPFARTEGAAIDQ